MTITNDKLNDIVNSMFLDIDWSTKVDAIFKTYSKTSNGVLVHKNNETEIQQYVNGCLELVTELTELQESIIDSKLTELEEIYNIKYNDYVKG